jgi:hypothetical protein
MVERSLGHTGGIQDFGEANGGKALVAHDRLPCCQNGGTGVLFENCAFHGMIISYSRPVVYRQLPDVIGLFMSME